MDRVDVRLPFAKFSTKQFSQSAACKRFTGIYARDRPFVRSVLLRLGVPARDVDDVAQEVFITCWQRLGELMMDVELRPWLYAVAYHRARNYRRLCRNTRVRFLGDTPEVGRIEFDPGWVMDAQRSYARIMRKLSQKLREVFVPVAIEGQSVEEVAAHLRIPRKTAESRMLLAREVVERMRVTA